MGRESVYRPFGRSRARWPSACSEPGGGSSPQGVCVAACAGRGTCAPHTHTPHLPSRAAQGRGGLLLSDRLVFPPPGAGPLPPTRGGDPSALPPLLPACQFNLTRLRERFDLIKPVAVSILLRGPWVSPPRLRLGSDNYFFCPGWCPHPPPVPGGTWEAGQAPGT